MEEKSCIEVALIKLPSTAMQWFFFKKADEGQDKIKGAAQPQTPKDKRGSQPKAKNNYSHSQTKIADEAEFHCAQPHGQTQHVLKHLSLDVSFLHVILHILLQCMLQGIKQVKTPS